MSDAVISSPATNLADSTVHVRLHINGEERVLQIDPRTTLLDALREHLAVTTARRAATRDSAAPAQFM